jgi:hypothetical protein
MAGFMVKFKGDFIYLALVLMEKPGSKSHPLHESAGHQQNAAFEFKNN